MEAQRKIRFGLCEKLDVKSLFFGNPPDSFGRHWWTLPHLLDAEIEDSAVANTLLINHGVLCNQANHESSLEQCLT